MNKNLSILICNAKMLLHFIWFHKKVPQIMHREKQKDQSLFEAVQKFSVNL
jgi:hypothetical protein